MVKIMKGIESKLLILIVAIALGIALLLVGIYIAQTNADFFTKFFGANAPQKVIGGIGGGYS